MAHASANLQKLQEVNGGVLNFSLNLKRYEGAVFLGSEWDRWLAVAGSARRREQRQSMACAGLV